MPVSSDDEHRIRGHWNREHTARTEQTARRHGNQVQTSPGKIHYWTAGDEHTLRGIPAIGRGVAGAISGTNPSRIGDR